MRINITTIIVLISMLITSIFIAYVVTLLSTDASTFKKQQPTTNSNSPIKLTDSQEHIAWFLQISDIHISIFNDQSRISQFREFCEHTVPAIKPDVVLASGDLTDAKTSDKIGSRQFESEWQHYRNILEETRIKEQTVWLDIRGNHDNFNVAGPDSRQNYFTNYSIQGSEHPRSYMYQLTKPGGNKYSFIGVDACLEPGPKRPFNFIGMLDQLEVDEINRLIERARRTNSNYTIWFGHFPTSCILTTGQEGIRELIAKDPNGLVYVCGHLHQLGGLVTRMYTLQRSGFLELELGDWKDNRVYRLIAIDHGLFSFIDLSHKQWPIALVTNPKHGQFINPAKENLEIMRHSTHIRVLAFSLVDIKTVKVRIDGNVEWLYCQRKHATGPLFVVKWKPQDYSGGSHNIEVYVKDIQGRENTYSQPFILDDNTRLNFNLLSRIVLMTDASVVFRGMFALMLVISILPLCILRFVHKLTKVKKLSKPRTVARGCCRLWLRKFWILSTVDRIFWPVVLYPIYLSFGPWSIGYLVEEHLGVIFAWGIFVNGAFLPGSLTYAYGFIQLVTFQVPLTFILAHAVDHNFQHKIVRPEQKKTICNRIALHLPFILLFVLQINMAYLFWLAYGYLAFILGPLRTWSLVLAAILWYQTLYLPKHCTREAAVMWHLKVDDNDTDPTTNSIQETKE